MGAWRGAILGASLGLDFTLRLDGFSFLFCLILTGIGALVIAYAGGYLTGRPRAERSRFFTLILLFLTAMLGTVLADNLLVLLLFWEAVSVLSFLHLFDGGGDGAGRCAGRQPSPIVACIPIAAFTKSAQF